VDKLTIDTPEQVHLEFTLAGIGSRFMAAFLDMLIQFVLQAILISSAIGLLTLDGFSKSSVWIGAVSVFVFFCINWGYYAAFEILWHGQTPGKRWAGIRVMKESGRPINAFEAITRNLLRVIDWLPGFYGFGVVTMMLNKKNRRLGDFVAGTLVVHESSDRESAVFFNTPDSTPYAFPQATRLSLQEVELIETFLARRLDIPPEVRSQSAARITEMVSVRLGIDSGSRPPDNENFLELVVKEFRNRARMVSPPRT
jgi:uncharacterized RDD family membrane protein YckC